MAGKSGLAVSLLLRALVFSVAILITTSAVSPASATAPSAVLPVAAQSGISAVLGQDSDSYHLAAVPGGWRAANAAHGLIVYFERDSVQIDTGDAQWGISLSAWGYGDRRFAVERNEPHTLINRVEYPRGNITEWYVNGPMGLEQGFTVGSPEGREPSTDRQLLTLELSLDGSASGTAQTLQARVDAGGRSLAVVDANGVTLLRYADLAARDAHGSDLPARLEVDGGHLLVQVDDTEAVYPLAIDPFIQSVILTASDGSSWNNFGSAVAVSGNTVVVGSPQSTVNGQVGAGAAYVFVKPTAGWTALSAYTAKLTASDPAVTTWLGAAVAISGDTIIVGAPYYNSRQGAAYVFVRPAAGWSGTLTQNAKLTASDGAANDYFAQAVSVSGTAVVIGAPFATVNTHSHQGAAYVFVRPISGWSGTLHQGAKLYPLGGAANYTFGTSVSIDATSIVVSAPGVPAAPNCLGGAIFLYIRPSGGWTGALLEDAKLTALDTPSTSTLHSVAISGNTVVAGTNAGAASTGAAYVFVRPLFGWGNTADFATKLTSSDGIAGDGFGHAVAIDGSTVVVSADLAQVGGNAQAGAAYLYVQPSNGWPATMTETQKLTASDAFVFDHYGTSVAVSGRVAVVGAKDATVNGHSQQGAAYLYFNFFNTFLPLIRQ